VVQTSSSRSAFDARRHGFCAGRPLVDRDRPNRAPRRDHRRRSGPSSRLLRRDVRPRRRGRVLRRRRGVRGGVAVEGAAAEFAHLDAGDATVELVEYDPRSESGADPELNRPGATHLGLSVDSVEQFYADLDEDVETLSPPRTTASGTTICFVRDPEGNLIEVLDA